MISSKRNRKKRDEPNGLKVELKPGEKVQSLLRRFNRKIEKSGLIKEVRRRHQYEKPSDRKRRNRVRWRKQIERDRREKEKLEKDFVL